ncbi:unnamed protein product [Adineta steineri]|uniref:Uncharacterized protein n=1 Tax=Adineta steineri TaxID=433720 RepID=A0A818Q7B0_9BILA|nr:unnamed protein product [Adineta steineri]CAF3636855.1 unnamed protein product [Adineta steineri]
MTNSNDNIVNLYNVRLEAFNIDQITLNAQTKLKQWHAESVKTINDIYQRKSQELTSYLDEAKNQYEEKKLTIQSNLNQLKDQHEINEENIPAKLIIRSIEQDLDDIEQLCKQINVRPLTIDDSYFHIEKRFSIRNSLQTPSTFGYSQISSSAIASSDKFLLIHQNPYLCLIDRDCRMVRQDLWNHDWIRDMCWSSTLCCFIIITIKDIYIIHEKNLLVAPFKEQFNETWFSCTCSDKSLYLSTCEWGSSIYELSLGSSMDLIKQWKSPFTCKSGEGIHDIKCNNETLALMIKDGRESTRRMELKLISTFTTLWSLPLGAAHNLRLFTCCPLKHNEWLVIDGVESNIYHITKQGKSKDNIHYPSVPYRANLFGSNILAIAAEDNLNLHRIST